MGGGDLKRDYIPGILALLALAFFSRLSPHFLDWHFLVTNSTVYMEEGLLALAMTFVIIAGQIDLSVASMMGLVACLTAKLISGGANLFLAILFAVVFGILLGTFNGVLVSKLKLPSFLVTLGTLATYRGLCQAILGPTSVALPSTFIGIDKVGIGGIPDPVILFIVLAIGSSLLLRRTVLGRWVIATGANESAARYSGIPVDRVTILTFAGAGLMAGIGALLMISRLGVAHYDLASGLELDVITVVVVGGTSIAGGQGSIVGTVLSLLLIDVIKTGMDVANIKIEYQLTVVGMLLILAVLTMNGADFYTNLRKNVSLRQVTTEEPQL